VTNLLDAYANNYLYLGPAVFYGTLTPSLIPGSPIANVPYRNVSKERANVDWLGGIGLAPDQQIYELWTKPMGGYLPAVNDVWHEYGDAMPWNILNIKSSDLVTSAGIPVNVIVLAQRAK
jgi:hypothetical protein